MIKDSFIQAGAVVLFAFLIHLLSRRSAKGFFSSLGFVRPEGRYLSGGAAVFGLSLVLMGVPFFIAVAAGSLSTADFSRLPADSGRAVLWGAVIAKSLVQTALAEEILFRGLVGGSLSRRFGYVTGNAAQSFLFALPHGLPVIFLLGKPVVGSLFLVSSFAVGWLMFWLKEKRSGGSLLPCIAVHGLTNLLSFISQNWDRLTG